MCRANIHKVNYRYRIMQIIITLQRRKSINTIATRSLSKNSTVEKLLFLPYITNKGISVLRKRENANKQEASYEKTNQMTRVIAIN
jgi:hypothetical protein